MPDVQPPRRLSLFQWDRRREELLAAGLVEPAYGGPLSRHFQAGDRRLAHLAFDDSAAALRLWNFLLSEEDRLRDARRRGCHIVGAMKDLGTVPVLAYSLDNVVAFYPDGAWWTPCLMENGTPVLAAADAAGIDDSFCPVRAMLGALVTELHFPLPDVLISSAGAVCDDFSAIAQRLARRGFPVFWWEMPHRRPPAADEAAVPLAGGLWAPAAQVAVVRAELARVCRRLERLAGQPLDDRRLAEGIRRANDIRRRLRTLREAIFTAPSAPLPALETLVAEMLAIHFCSDQAQTAAVLDDLLAEVRRRAAGGPADNAVRVYWINPVADLRAMNLLEEAGGRLVGADFMFCHALDEIAEDLPPLEALARTALADPMVGSADERALRIVAEMRRFGAEAAVISRIPGASHCALEGESIARRIRRDLDVPVVDVEVPPLTDAVAPSLRTRLEALVETARGRAGRAG